ncbi:MAG: arylsulfotransferase family protein [Pseudomonadota bacterium]
MKITEKTERQIFLGSAASLLVLAGILLGTYAPPVKNLAVKAGDKIEDIKRNGLAYLGMRPSGHIAPLRAEIFSAISPDVSRAAPGVTLITGLFGNKLAARLYDRDGAVIYEWPNDLFDLFADKKKYKFDALVHGDFLYPNGDLLVIIDHVGMARISACGDIIWQARNGAHHSIDIDDDGYIWAPRGGKTYDDRRLADTKVKIDRIAKIDPATGKEVESFELAKILLDAGLEGIIKSNRLRPEDVFHLNDVEILKKSMAAAFPMFAAGDIMLSGRNTNAIIILDGGTHQVKWWRVGPMHGQHDPDFQATGEITLLDNRTAEPASKKNHYLGGANGSRIIAINPANYGYRELYASNETNKFYSAYRGKHQMLENENILIAESEAGRAFEVTPDGDIAWMVVSKYDDKSVGWLTSATRYPESYAAVGKNCPAK